jgi:DNA-binding HxlR family transcriptional regulator
VTPFELEILLHMYYTPTKPDAFVRRAPILPETLVAFVQEGLIEESEPTEPDYCGYRLTERGTAYIEHVLAVPLPVVKWVLPDYKKWDGPSFPPRQ